MPHPLRELRDEHVCVLQQALTVQQLLLQRWRRVVKCLHLTQVLYQFRTASASKGILSTSRPSNWHVTVDTTPDEVQQCKSNFLLDVQVFIPAC